MDRYDIGPQIALQNQISLARLRELLTPFKSNLPSGVSTSDLSKLVFSKLSEIAPEVSVWRDTFASLHPKLEGIPAGRPGASNYHLHVFDLLRAIFDGLLTNGKCEQKINNGIQRVDIMFENSSHLFERIAASVNRPSPYLPFECKNYVDDLDAPEYDQLSGRLNKDVGAVGILVFRSISNWERANQYCQAKLKDDKVILLLDDKDLKDLYQLRHDGGASSVEEYIGERWKALRLNVSAK